MRTPQNKLINPTGELRVVNSIGIGIELVHLEDANGTQVTGRRSGPYIIVSSSVLDATGFDTGTAKEIDHG